MIWDNLKKKCMQRGITSHRCKMPAGRFQLRTLLVVLMLTLSQRGWAYEKDTHYYLTYCLARLVGFTVTQSWQLARGDWSIDMNKATEPVQSFIPYDSTVVIRSRYHAMPAGTLLDALKAAYLRPEGISGSYWADASYTNAVQEQAGILWARGTATGNIGPYLHYLQDSYAHKGFYATWGHPPFRGATPDYVSHNIQYANSMAFAVVHKLQEFYSMYLDKAPCRVNDNTVLQLVKAVYDANPNAGTDMAVLSFFSSAGGAGVATIKSLASTDSHKPWEMAETPYVAFLGNAGPDVEKAKAPLEKIIKETIPGFDCYQYNRMADCTDAGFKLEINPIEEVVGTWQLEPGKHNPPDACAANDSLDRVYFDVKNDDCQSGKRAIVFWGKYCWENGTYDKAGDTWTFERVPARSELNSNLSEKEKDAAVRDSLEWHLTLQLKCNDNGYGKMLEEIIYQGEIRKDLEENARTESTIKEEDSVIRGRKGWGSPNKPIHLYWWGAGMRICAPHQATAPATAARDNGPCDNCGPRYCNTKNAFSLKTARKAQIKRYHPEYTDEILSLVDRLPNCEACIMDAPDAIHIFEIDNRGNMKSWEWSPHDDDISRNDLKSGKIKAYYIVLAAQACSCCGEPQYYERSDWDSVYEFNKNLAIAHTR